MEIVNKKMTIFYICVFSVLMLLTIFAVSYSYYESQGNNEYISNYNTSFDGYNFKTYVYDVENNLNPSVSAEITDFDMYNYGTDQIVFEDTKNVVVELENIQDEAVTCTYDIAWKWADGSDYVISRTGINEFTISGTGISENNISDAPTTHVITSGRIISEPGTTESNSQYLIIKFYNLTNVDQTIHANKNYSGSIVVENVNCVMEEQSEPTYYYAFGQYAVGSYPTTITDYTTLGKGVFVRDDEPSTPDREVCIVRTEGNPGLHCFQNNNWEVEQQHVQDVFSDISCIVDSSLVDCRADDFSCFVYSYGDVSCTDYSTGEYCYVSSDGSVSC